MIEPADSQAIRRDLIRAYDAAADARDERGEAEWRAAHQRAFAEMLRSEGKSRILEIGAGSGHSAVFFQTEGFAIVATDLSPENVARCRAKGVDAVVGDFYDLDFPDDSFDAAWAMSCLMHVPDADLNGVLEEMARVLVPGGIAMIGLWGGRTAGRGTSGVWEGDDYTPPRFFALRDDEEVTEAVGAVFTIERFVTTTDRPDDPVDMHYQLVTVRKP